MVFYIAILGVVLLALLASGMSIGLGIAGVGIVGLEFLRGLGEAVGAVLYNSVNSFTLAAIPFFLLLGQFILHSGLGEHLYKGVSRWTGVIPGGLLHSNILSCAIFAAVSGSSLATLATVSSNAYPEQKQRGYDLKTVAGSLAAGGTLGILIPPSINMIVYGAFVGESVGRRFAGGIVPGITLSAMFMIYIASASLKNKSLAPPREGIPKRYFLDALIAWKDIWPIFFLIVLILGSIYGGIMTPTEAGAASAFLALVLGTLFGKMNFAVLKKAVVETLRLTTMILLLYVGGCILGAAVGLLRIPAQVANLIVDLGLGPLPIWFALVLMYIVLGCLMSVLEMMIITLPVTYPIVVGVCGFDPVWFGVQLVILCEIGQVTPPVGLNLFIMYGIAKEELTLESVIRGILPFFVCMVLAILLFTFQPNLILFLPSHMIGVQ